MSIAELDTYLGDLRTANPMEDVLFHRLVRRGLELTTTTDADFAEVVGVSRPTATRWKNGTAAPHPALRPAIYAALKKQAERTIRLLEAHAAPPPARSFAPAAGQRLSAKSRE